MKKVICSQKAPGAIGPYSQAVEVNGTLYISGQLPLKPDGSMPVSIEEQTEQALRNIGAILQAAGYGFDDVVKSTVLLTDMNEFGAMNEAYARFYTKDMPARVAYQVVRLPKNAKIEIETIACR